MFEGFRDIEIESMEGMSERVTFDFHLRIFEFFRTQDFALFHFSQIILKKPLEIMITYQVCQW